MNTFETQQLINASYGEINDLKIYLSDTDYKIVREYEGGEPAGEETKTRRTNARARINELESNIIVLKQQYDAASEEEQNPENHIDVPID